MSTSSRLLALLSLLQTPRAWSGGELAARLGVSRRTVRRDVDRLRELGYPVEGTLGAEGGYRLGAGKELPPLLLDDDEAVAIVIGLRMAASRAVVGIDDASARALAKLEQVLPARLRSRFEGLRSATSQFDWHGPSVDPAVLSVVARAISGRERLRFTYSTGVGTVGRRSVDPNGLVVVGRRWYLVAWDEDRDDWRIFRADRMTDVWATGRPGADRRLPGGADPATYVREHQLSLAPTYRLVATLQAPIDRVRAAVGEDAELQSIAAGRTRLTIEDDTLEWLAVRLIHLDCDFDIDEPAELRVYLAGIAERLGRGVGGADATRGPLRRPRAASRCRSSAS